VIGKFPVLEPTEIGRLRRFGELKSDPVQTIATLSLWVPANAAPATWSHWRPRLPMGLVTTVSGVPSNSDTLMGCAVGV
jgi:hypothetical protein